MLNQRKKIHSLFLFWFCTTIFYFVFIGGTCPYSEDPIQDLGNLFNYKVEPKVITILQNDTGIVNISVSDLERATTRIDLSLIDNSIAPFIVSDLQYNFQPDTIDEATSSVLSIFIPENIQAGTYDVLVKFHIVLGDSGRYETGELRIIVKESITDFSLSLSKTNLSIEQGVTDTLTVFVNRSGGHNNPVTLSLESLPSDVTGTFDPPVVSANENSSKLTLSADNNAAINSGTPVLVKGTDGSLESSIYFSLEVTGYVNPWQTQSFGQYNTLYSVHFTDVNHGAAVGWSGTFIKTSNGGSDWQKLPTNTNEYLNAVQFIDAMTGYIVGDNNKFLFTSDGGSNWIDTLGVDTISTDFKGLYFLSAQKGWIVGTHIFYTVNGGENWDIQLGYEFGRVWRDIAFGNSTTGAAVGYKSGFGGVITYTNDGGYNWFESHYPSGINQMNAVCFINSTTAFAVGNSGIVLKSIDGGANWASLTNTSDYLRGVSFADENNGWVVSSSIMHTTDGGQTWVEEMALTRAAFDVYFLNSETGYVVGGSGIILRRK